MQCRTCWSGARARAHSPAALLPVLHGPPAPYAAALLLALLFRRGHSSEIAAHQHRHRLARRRRRLVTGRASSWRPPDESRQDSRLELDYRRAGLAAPCRPLGGDDATQPATVAERSPARGGAELFTCERADRRHDQFLVSSLCRRVCARPAGRATSMIYCNSSL
jgi:hypothetical protein